MLRADRGGWPYGHPPNADFVLNTLSPQARGLVAWYPLGPGQYRWRDVQSRYHLAPTNGPTICGGSRGLVTLFNDTASQRLVGTGAVVTTPPFTISAWVRFDDLAPHQGIAGVFDAGDSNYHYLMLYGNPYYSIDAVSYGAGGMGDAYTDTAVAVNTWSHVCGVWEATNRRTAYLNAGGSHGPETTNVVPAGLQRTVIGARSATNYMSGMIADVRFYNRALTLNEIKQIYRNPWELYQPVVRWWVGAALGSGGGTDALAADNLATGAPSLGTPTIGQKHALTATALATGAPSLATPTLGQIHALTADNLAAGTPALGTPDIGQAHALTATNVATGAPSLGTPTIGQTHALTADNLATGAPVPGEPSVGQEHALTASALATGAPVAGTPTLGQEHALLASGITTEAPALGTPAIGQEHALTATGITTGAPVVGTPTLGEAGAALTADSLAAGTPVLGTPTLGQVHALVATVLLVGVPLLGSPTLGTATLANEWRTWDVPADTRSYSAPAGGRSSTVGTDTRTKTVVRED